MKGESECYLLRKAIGLEPEGIPMGADQEIVLAEIDQWIDDISTTFDDYKEHGVWGAEWRRSDRQVIKKRNNA